MPICKICNKLIKPLGMPVCLVEQMDVYLTKIVDNINYEMSDNYYRHPAHFPVPAVRLVAEYQPNNPCVIVYDAAFKIHKVWTYHGGNNVNRF